MFLLWVNQPNISWCRDNPGQKFNTYGGSMVVFRDQNRNILNLIMAIIQISTTWEVTTNLVCLINSLQGKAKKNFLEMRSKYQKLRGRKGTPCPMTWGQWWREFFWKGHFNQLYFCYHTLGKTSANQSLGFQLFLLFTFLSF